jgi:hypothetical protein
VPLPARAPCVFFGRNGIRSRRWESNSASFEASRDNVEDMRGEKAR